MKPGKIFGIVAVLVMLAVAVFAQASTGAPKIVISERSRRARMPLKLLLSKMKERPI
jgi:hypothetical protein